MSSEVNRSKFFLLFDEPHRVKRKHIFFRLNGSSSWVFCAERHLGLIGSQNASTLRSQQQKLSPLFPNPQPTRRTQFLHLRTRAQVKNGRHHLWRSWSRKPTTDWGGPCQSLCRRRDQNNRNQRLHEERYGQPGAAKLISSKSLRQGGGSCRRERRRRQLRASYDSPATARRGRRCNLSVAPTVAAELADLGRDRAKVHFLHLVLISQNRYQVPI